MINVVIRGVVITTALTHQTAPTDRGQPKGQCMKTGMMGSHGFLMGVPFITANSVRGLIRRAAANVIFEKLAAAKAQIHRNLYLSIVRGAYARTGINAKEVTYTHLLAAKNHTFAGLFGGGAFMYKSPMRFERDLLPILESTRGLFPTEVQSYAIEREPWQIIQKTMMAPRDDFARLPDSARAVVSNLAASYAEHMQTKIDQNAVKAEDSTASKDDLDNFMGDIECIVPGVPLYFGMTAKGVTEAQAGLLIEGVRRWANDNVLGGGGARGRGAFMPLLSLSLDGKLIAPELLVGDAPNLALVNNPAVKALLDACNQAIIEDAKAESLADVYPVDLNGTKAKAKPAAKAG